MIWTKKGSTSLTTKTLYAVFLVIFLSFIAFTVVNSRSSVLSQKEFFDSHRHVDNFFAALLTSPCTVQEHYPVIDGRTSDRNYQIETEGYLMVDKLTYLDKENKDIYCVDSYHFLYTVIIEDLMNKKEWVLGLRGEPNWAYGDQGTHVISRSYPVALNYNFAEIHPGYATIYAYVGDIPRLYGTIKMACVARDQRSLSLDLPVDIKFTTEYGEFCIGAECFFAFFPCRVKEFSIPAGERLVLITPKDDGVEVMV
ncbi:MAG: hypothetical protein ABIC95_06340 [archaeon]